MNKLRIEVIPSTELNSKLKKDIKKWLISEFIDDDDETIWSDVDWHIIGWKDNGLVSHSDILERIVIVGGVKVPIAGIGGVVTKTGWRGRRSSSCAMYPEPDQAVSSRSLPPGERKAYAILR
jgi:hypothetical protein